MSKFRILFLGTPEFAVKSLDALLADEHFEIAAVVTQPDRPAGRRMQLTASPVKKLALERGLDVRAPETVNDDQFRAEIAAMGVESAVVVAFGQILGQKFLDLFSRGAVNVHGSILPRWRGAAPIQRALMAGDRDSGVSLQTIVRKLDAGPLLGVRRVSLDEAIDARELYDRLAILGADLLKVEYVDYLRGNLTPVTQDESLVTIAAKIEKSEARIDWRSPAQEIANKIRGLALGPFASTTFRGASLKIHRARVHNPSLLTTSRDRAGEITVLGAESVIVACSQGALEVLEVQPESRSRISSKDFLHGYNLKNGDRFES